jgi:hypothetical protein
MSIKMAVDYPDSNAATPTGTRAQGFVVLDARGEFIAWSPCIVSAREAQRAHFAARIERCSDGEVMSYRARSPKRWRFEEAVPA